MTGKKTGFFIPVSALIFLMILPVMSIGFQVDEEIVIPPDAHSKAMEALKALGPERGALTLHAKVLGIEGVISGISSRSEKIKAALKDLGAEETDTDYVIELEGDVLFDFNKASIRGDAEESLRKVGEVIRAFDHAVTITGHTDAKGADAYNLELSRNRAESVRNWLVENAGIDAHAITTAGRGESEPAAPNSHPDGTDNPEGRQKNRRVEIRVRK